MKKVYYDKIINVSWDPFDGRFILDVATNINSWSYFDMSEKLLEYKNENLNYKADYKLWSQVYSPKDELKIFEEIFEKAINTWNKIHIANISLLDEIELIKKLYLDLWYFNTDLNCFIVDFDNCPVTIWVNLRNAVYSFKDYKNLRDKVLFVPPPREPKHEKAIRASINSWLVSTITLNDDEQDIRLLEDMISWEKTSLLRLASCLWENYKKIWIDCDFYEIMLNIKYLHFL